MLQTLSCNLVHIIFSTRDRRPLIADPKPLHAYLAGTIRSLGCFCIGVGGVADHVHLALRLPPAKFAAKVVSEIKTGSTAWMRAQGVTDFSWQRGYALFSVSASHAEALVKYINDQQAHHSRRSFEDELRAICRRYHVDLDERYVWD
jgi:REP element-mobilizing transposase RayT